MTTVMVSGNFDPFHDMHLDYIEQATKFGDKLVCVISSDKQIMMKKGKVNIPESGRFRIIDLILKGLDVNHQTIINYYDAETTLVAEALRTIQPDIFFRGGDKTLETMPVEERKVCEELGIIILHGIFKANTHGSKMEIR